MRMVSDKPFKMDKAPGGIAEEECTRHFKNKINHTPFNKSTQISIKLMFMNLSNG